MRLRFDGVRPAFRRMSGDKFSQKLRNGGGMGVGNDGGISCGHRKLGLKATSIGQKKRRS
jgi:hypothetical protein